MAAQGATRVCHMWNCICNIDDNDHSEILDTTITLPTLPWGQKPALALFGTTSIVTTQVASFSRCTCSRRCCATKSGMVAWACPES